MPKPGRRASHPRKAAPRTVKARAGGYPNRIAELTRLRETTYAKVGDEVGAHEITIAKLATGKQKLTVDWMVRLAPAYGVSPAEIAWPPPAKGLRRIRVRIGFEADRWRESNEWEDGRRYEVMIPDDPRLRSVSLYAGEMLGESMNKRYAAGTVLVIAAIDDDAAPMREGQRYHVRRTRPDGQVEDSIRTLVRHDDGSLWLAPESTDPRHQEWIPLEARGGERVELIGRVRYAVQRED